MKRHIIRYVYVCDGIKSRLTGLLGVLGVADCTGAVLPTGVWPLDGDDAGD